MTTQDLSEKQIVELYAADRLPPCIDVINVPITIGYQDWYVTPHGNDLADKLYGEALPARNLKEAQSQTDRVTINEYTIGGETIYAGYSSVAKTLIVGKAE